MGPLNRARTVFVLSVVVSPLGCGNEKSSDETGGVAASGGALATHSGGRNALPGGNSSADAGGSLATTGGKQPAGGTTSGITTSASVGGVSNTTSFYAGGATASTGGITAVGGSKTTVVSTGGNAQGGTTVVGTSATGGVTTVGGSKTTVVSTGGNGQGGSTVAGGTRASGGGTAAGGSNTTATSATGGNAQGGSTAAGGTGANAGASFGGGSASGGATQGSGGSSGLGGTGAPSCPTYSDYVGSTAWHDTIEVTNTAEYCGNPSENRTLEQELAAKVKMRIPAGTYPLPDAVGSFPFAWPVCFEFPPGTDAPRFAGAGQMSLQRSTFSPTEYYTYRGSQPLKSAQSNTIVFKTLISNETTVGAGLTPLVLDGGPPEQLGRRACDFEICQAATCSGLWNEVGFYSCNASSDRLIRDTIAFSGGQVVLELRVGQSMASTEPSSFVAASGTLDGVAFTQNDYWKLVYRPGHHHFVRNYAVLFTTPIAGACGIKVESVSDPAISVHTVNCDLSNIATRAVTSSTTERL